MAAYAAFQPPPTPASYTGSNASDTASIRSLALPPISSSGPFLGSGPSSANMSDEEAARTGASRPPMRSASSQSGRCSSLPPPSVMPHRPYRRRTQEARDMAAMQSLMPQLYPDGRHDTMAHRPGLEHASSYVTEGDVDSPAASTDSADDIPMGWRTPSTDHPLTAAEAADMLERVQADLLGIDLSKLKGPLAQIARKNRPEEEPAKTKATSAFRSSPKTSMAESMTVSPKEAFLDYDAVSATKFGGSVSPVQVNRDGRFSSPMPSLFAPLPGPSSSLTTSSPLRTTTRFTSEARDLSPPFGATSSALIRGASTPAPISPRLSRSVHATRLSLEPEAAPRNAVRWVSTKREPIEGFGMPSMADNKEGDFDWSPSSEEEGGLPLENPPTPPPVNVAGQPLASKADTGMPFAIDSHPLSADLAYISPLPTPSFATDLPANRPSTVDAWQSSRALAQSFERTAVEEEDASDEEMEGKRRGNRESSEEWMPSVEDRTVRQRAMHAGPSSSTLPSAPVTPAKRSRAAPTREDYTDDNGMAAESSSDEVVPAAKQRKGKDGKRAPPRQRANGSRNAVVPEGSILCDFVDPDTGVVCGTPFRRPYDLARHKDTKHIDRGNKPQWVCDSCGSSFSRRDALMRHSRLRNHKMPS